MKYIFFLLLISTSSFAKDKAGYWLGTFSNSKLTEKYSFWIEAQLRYDFEEGQTGQFLYRTGVLQKLDSKNSLGYLYGFITTASANEHRLTLQHSMKYTESTSMSLSHRARLEFRELEDNPINAGRFRYLIRLSRKSKNKLNLALWNEFFINTNETKWNGDRVFDRNRFFIGLNNLFLNNKKFEFGYLNQFIPRKSKDTYEHILVTYFFF